jgi:hypothetical protein
MSLAAVGAILLGVMLYTPAFAACTCTVTGTLTLHDSCHETTLNLWVQEYENPPEPGPLVWTLKMSLEHVGDGEYFVFYPVECHFSCSARARIKSKGDILHEFYLPGVGGTVDVGTIYDPNRCGKKENISEVPPPPPN